MIAKASIEKIRRALKTYKPKAALPARVVKKHSRPKPVAPVPRRPAAEAKAPRREVNPILFSRIASETQRLSAASKSLAGRLSSIEASRRRVVRYAQIDNLAGEFVLDHSAEQRRADEYDDVRWDDHVGNVVKFYQRRSPDLLAQAARNPDALPPAVNTRVREMIDRYSRQGKRLNYEAIVAEVRQQS